MKPLCIDLFCGLGGRALAVSICDPSVTFYEKCYRELTVGAA